MEAVDKQSDLSLNIYVAMQICVLLVSSGADRISEAETKRGGD